MYEYSNLPLPTLLKKISGVFNLQVKTMCVKLIEETRISRVDTQIYAKDNPNRMNSVKDLKICHNSALLVEEKDPSEIEEDVKIG